MSGTALIELQGVLRSDIGGPIPEGVTLYAALAAFYRLVLVVPDTADERWLSQNGLTEHAQLLVGEMDTAVRQARGKLGMDVRLVVSASPSTVAACMHAGMTSVLFAHPRFARPEFRSDHEREPRQWDEIVAELEGQRSAHIHVPHLGDD